MTLPLVSVVIPCYNAAPWLGETLESVFSQSWPQVEVVLVDDGSTDDSLAIAARFQGRPLRILRQQQRGVSAARNAGMAASNGQFIQLLDADDLLSPDKLQTQIEALQRAPALAIAVCSWRKFAGRAPASAAAGAGVPDRVVSPVDFVVHTADGSDIVHLSAWLLPAAVVRAAGEFNTELLGPEDVEFLMRAALRSGGIVHCAGGESYYRVANPGSLSRRRTPRACASAFRAAELMSGHLLAAEDSDRVRAVCARLYRNFLIRWLPIAPAPMLQQAETRMIAYGHRAMIPSRGYRLVRPLLAWIWRLRLRWYSVRLRLASALRRG